MFENGEGHIFMSFNKMIARRRRRKLKKRLNRDVRK